MYTDLLTIKYLLVGYCSYIKIVSWNVMRQKQNSLNLTNVPYIDLVSQRIYDKYKSSHILNNVGFPMKGRRIRSKSVLVCTHFRIHRYVAAPPGRNPLLCLLAQRKFNSKRPTIVFFLSPTKPILSVGYHKLLPPTVLCVCY